MSTIPLGPTPAKQPSPGLVPFALGFRPFFLLAALSALALMLPWLLMWVGGLAPVEYYGFIGWHSHEMLFGYAMAIIAGFLLTAVRNWTGIDTPSGAPLAALAALWLAGRLLPLATSVVPLVLVAVVDWLFIPAVALALFHPLWRGGNKINRVFLPLLAAMALANGLVHAQALGWGELAARGQDLMLNMILLLIALVGGRVMPFFTEKAVTGSTPRRSERLEQAAFACLIALILVELVYPVPIAVAMLSLAVALTQALRVIGWHCVGVWRIPILWVLYTGFGWMVLGFVLKGLGALNLFPSSLALHALTVGAIAVLTLGMMSRVALGHTGRDLRSHKSINIAFVLLNLAAVARVFGPLLLPNYTGAVHLSGGLWLLAFLAFTVVYTPVLLQPRVDGRPG